MGTNKKNYIKTIGYVLIAPALISVPLLFYDEVHSLLFGSYIEVLGDFFWGDYNLKYYVCFIGAIGAYLLKDKN